MLITVVAVVTGIAYLYLHDPMVGRFYPPCLFHQASGLFCPGCGTARALHALTHGQLGTALGHNLLAVLCLPMLAVAALREGLLVLRNKPRRAFPIPAACGWGLILVFLLYWAVRNIPLYPFTWLAP